MQLSDYLQAENVAIDLVFNSKKELLSKLAEFASQKTGVSRGVIARSLEAREGLGSTGIGDGVAIPHAIIDTLEQSCCMLLLLKRPLEFEAVDEVPVDIVVLLLSPPMDQGQSLNVLSCVARKLRDTELAKALRNATSPDEVYVLITQA